MLNFLRHGWADIVRELEDLRGAPFVAGLLVLCGLLLSTQQGADLTETAVRNGSTSAWLLAAALFYGLECWFWTRFITERRAERKGVRWDADITQVWAPRVLGAAPFVLAGAAVLHAHTQNISLAVTLFVLAVVMLAGLIARRPVLKRLGLHPGQRLSLFLRCASLILAAAAMVFFALAPVRPAQMIGAIAVVYFGLAFITAVMAAVLHASRASRLPILSGLLIWAAVLSFFIDNHQVGGRAFGAARHTWPVPSGQPESLDDELTAWCAQAHCTTDGAATPIVFVAAQGGASRAGYWAADVLGHLQHFAGVGAFSDHVFAISSVSGGSVGAVAYLSTLHDSPDLAPTAFQPAVAAVAGADYLSPAVAGLLFPDLLQRFLPVAFLPDRAQTLEQGFEAGWKDHCQPSGAACHDAELWSEPFLSLWTNNAHWQPVLFINGAREEDGRRIITSNVAIDPNYFPDAVDFHGLTGRDVGISTAISNGARFPLVSPGGTLRDSAGANQGHVLDGGYFDGGGVVTMADVAVAVTELAKARGITLRPIFIELDNDTSADATSPDLVRAMFDKDHPSAGLYKSATHPFLPDVLGPLDGLSQARGAHGTAAGMSLALQVARARSMVTPAAARAMGTSGAVPPAAAGTALPSYYFIHACPDGTVGMPMDWALSKPAKDAADNALVVGTGPPALCDNDAKFKALAAELTPQAPAAP